MNSITTKYKGLISYFWESRYILFVAAAYLLWGLFWLLGNWPGAMTPDSLAVWEQSTTWSFNNAHPWINAFSYSIARSVWDSPACIAVLQITGFSALFTSVLIYFYRRGIRIWFLAIVGLCYLCSLPVWLYAITLWKDVPFTLCLVFALFHFFRIVQEYRAGGRIAGISTGILLAMCIIGTFSFRHNGIFAFGILFFMLHPAFGSWKRRGFLLSGTIFGIVLMIMIIPRAIGAEARTNRPFYQLAVLINPIAALHHAPGGYRTDNYEGDLQALMPLLDPAELKLEYNPRHFRPALRSLKTRTVEPEQASLIIRTYLPRFLQNPDIIIADRVRIFISAIMTTSPGYGMKWFNLLGNNADLKPSVLSTVKSIRYNPTKIFARIQKPIIQKSLDRAGPWGQLLFWNGAPALIITVLMLALYPFMPSTAAIAAIVLILTAGTVAVMPADTFRYFFYLYVLSPVLLLMGLTEGKRSLHGLPRLLLFSTEANEEIVVTDAEHNVGAGCHIG